MFFKFNQSCFYIHIYLLVSLFGEIVSNMVRALSQGENKKTLEEIFQEVNRRYVKINKNHRKINNSILFSVLDELLKIMRNCDNLFEIMKPKLEYLGSYYEGLRVGEPTEYDINVVLTLHMDYNKIQLDAYETQHGYTTIKMPAEFRRLSKTPATAVKGFRATELWCDNKHRLSVRRFRSWMQGVVDAALNTLEEIENGKRILKVSNRQYHIAYTTSGPANTFTIYSANNKIADVDLVPIIAFKYPKTKPFGSNIDFRKVINTNITSYFAVPKPSDNAFSWRLAFPYQERYYINDMNNLKSTLKLLKLLRDVQDFKKLASYFIKTLFLWEVVEQDRCFWKNKSISSLVLHMLKKLRDCLLAGTIQNFWCSEHNLLEKLKPTTCKNWANCLSNIINDIEQNKIKNPDIVLKYFTNKKKEARSSINVTNVNK